MKSEDRHLLNQIEMGGYQYKFSRQLRWIAKNNQKKIGRVRKYIERVGGYGEFLSRHALTQVDKLMESIDLSLAEVDFRQRKLVERQPIGTTYYIDADSGDSANSGTAIGDAFRFFRDFSQLGASAPGDVCIIRNGRTNRIDDDGVDGFLNDGQHGNPITMQRDYANAWSDDTTSAFTFTPTPGSKILVGSATVTDIGVGDWVYVSGDDAEKYSYEVDTVSGVNVTLYLPYKGNQSGAGNSVINIGKAPVFGEIATDPIQITSANDIGWILMGINMKGNTVTGMFLFGDATFVIRDFSVECNGSAFLLQGSGSTAFHRRLFSKCRFHNYQRGLHVGSSRDIKTFSFKNCLFDGNSVLDSTIIKGLTAYTELLFEETEFLGHSTMDFNFNGDAPTFVRARNCIFSATPQGNIGSDAGDDAKPKLFASEDHNGVVNVSYIAEHLSESVSDTPVKQSDTGTVRSGGNTFSIKVTPGENIGPDFPDNRIEVLNMPIYSDASSKTVTVYVKTNATTNWTANPTAKQLILEVEYIISSSPYHRKVIASASTANFIGSTSWIALTIAFTPFLSGQFYLRLLYGKPKESGKLNEFFVDPKFEVS